MNWIIIILFGLISYLPKLFDNPINNQYPLINSLNLSETDLETFTNQGFLHLPKFLQPITIQQLKIETDRHQRPFYWKPIEYAFLSWSQQLPVIDSLWIQSNLISQVWSHPNLVKLISNLFSDSPKLVTDLTITLPKGRKPKYIGDWHYDTCSYDIISINDLGISLWIPLNRINSSEGGSLYVVPICNNRVHHQSEDCYLLLERSKIAHHYNLGDAIIFDKYTYHRTQPLLARSDLTSRTALVGRFTANATYRPTINNIGFRQRKDSCPHGLGEGDPLVSHCFPPLNNFPIARKKPYIRSDLVHLVSESLRLILQKKVDVTDC